MKVCPNCQEKVSEKDKFCNNCGEKLGTTKKTTKSSNSEQTHADYIPPYDPYDHTDEFDAKDISENKVICMLVYLTGFVGIIIALLGSSQSKYVAFHVRQALKFEVVNILMLLCTLCLFWTIIVPIAYLVLTLVLLVARIICFFQVCSGKAKEPTIIRELNFLK